jgi:hypothetical protein
MLCQMSLPVGSLAYIWWGQVPALLRFNGHAEVGQNGELFYIFPELQRTGGWQVGLSNSHDASAARSACALPTAAAHIIAVMFIDNSKPEWRRGW